MHRFLTIAAASLVLVSPTLARAADDPISGAWVVHGKVETFAFILNCAFERHGDRLGGVCVDDVKNTRHPLTAGTVSGDRVTFTYQAKFLLTRFDVVYAGALKAGQMAGTVKVPGHAGTFTAALK